MQNLRSLPKFRDSLSYLYLEHVVIHCKDSALEAVDETGRILIPAAALSVLLLGPGTSITHAAVKLLAESGSTILWVGEDSTRFYAQGIGETRRAYRLLRQAELAVNETARKEVVLRMYQMRFDARLPDDLTLPQIRGYEGVHVRDAYAHAGVEYNVEWQGRNYDRSNWHSGDPINRALSAANTLLNGICHAAIVSIGYSPALGFIHTGKQLSFVYDIADLYKTEITIPIAFQTVGASTERVEPRVRAACRRIFYEKKLLRRIPQDIDQLLQVPDLLPEEEANFDEDPALPSSFWEPLNELEDGEC